MKKYFALFLFLLPIAVSVAQTPKLGAGVPVSGGSNPVPTLSSISPSTATAGGATFTLTLTGTNFIGGSSVRWNGSSRMTTYVSSTSLTAQILNTDIASAGTASVTVFNPTPGGGTSSAQTLTISASAAAFYAVATSGATSGSCPIGTPCTLMYLLGASSPATPGSTIYLRGGTAASPHVYSSGEPLNGDAWVAIGQPASFGIRPTFVIGAAGGTMGNPITITPYAAEYVNIQGGFFAPNSLAAGFGDYYTFDGKMQGVVDNVSSSTSEKPVAFETYKSGWTIRNWYVDGTGGAVYVWGAADNYLAENLLVDNVGFGTTAAYPDPNGNGFGGYFQNNPGNAEKILRTSFIGRSGRGCAKAFAQGGEVHLVTFNKVVGFNCGKRFTSGSYAHGGFSMLTDANPGINLKLTNSIMWMDGTKYAYPIALGFDNYMDGTVMTGNYFVGAAGAASVKYQRNATITGNDFYARNVTGLNDALIQTEVWTGDSHSTAGNTYANNKYWHFDSGRTVNQDWFKTDTVTGVRQFNTTYLGRPSWTATMGEAGSSSLTDPTGTVKTAVIPFENGMPYAYVVIINWTAGTTRTVDMSSFLAVGQSWEARHTEKVLNPRSGTTPMSFDTTPDQAGTGQSITFSLNGLYGTEAAVFLVKKL